MNVVHLGRRLLLFIVAVAIILSIGLAVRSELGAGVFHTQSALGANDRRMLSQEEGILAIVGAGEAALYDTPGGSQVQTLPAGTVLTAVGRTADNQWVVVVNSEGVAGWIEVSQVVLFGIDQLPVMMDDGGGSMPATPATAVALPTLTPTPRATPTPTPRPTPTYTPTPSPTPTLPPTPTAALSSTSGSQLPANLVAVVRGGGTDLYGVPGDDVIISLSTGTALSAMARTPDSQWLLVTTGTGDAGWVAVESVVVFNIESLPVIPVGQEAQVADAVRSAGSVPPQSGDGDADTGADEEAVEDQSSRIPLLPSEGREEEGGFAPATLTQASSIPTTDSSTTGSAAAEIRPTPIAGPGEIVASVTVTDSRLNIRSGPGTEFGVIGKALPGESFIAMARNGAATWVQLEVDDLEEGMGWVSVMFVEITEPVVNLPISQPTSLATSSGNASQEANPSPAVSGRLVFQASSGGTIYVYDLEDGTLRSLTGGFDPAISPDGSTVAFTRIGGEKGLYLIDIDGSDERLIYNGNEQLRAPHWSPDGTWIVFSRAAGDYQCRDVGFGICLPDNPFLDSFPLDNRTEYGLSRVNTDGQEFRDLPALTSAQAPDWHEDGIVYQSNTGLEITQDEPDVTTQVVVNSPFYRDPAWRPGGDQIVFQGQEGGHWEIFSINSDGSGLVALTRPVTTLVDELPSNVAPAWSPDGDQIIFLSNRDEDNSAGAWQFWVMDADGGNQRLLLVDVPIEYSFMNEQVVSWGRG